MLIVEGKMINNDRGKIARLPADLGEPLNQRLEAGETGKLRPAPYHPRRNQPNEIETRLNSPRIQVNPTDTSISFRLGFAPRGATSAPEAGRSQGVPPSLGFDQPRRTGPSPCGFHRKQRGTANNGLIPCRVGICRRGYFCCLPLVGRPKNSQSGTVP